MAPMTTWAVTDTVHRQRPGTCQACMALARPAVTNARAMGTWELTYKDGEHGVTVRRALAVLEVKP